MFLNVNDIEVEKLIKKCKKAVLKGHFMTNSNIFFQKFYQTNMLVKVISEKMLTFDQKKK